MQIIGQISYFVIVFAYVFLVFWRPQVAIIAFICIFGIEQWGQLYVPITRNIGYFSNLLILVPAWIAILLQLGRAKTQLKRRSSYLRLFAIMLYAWAAMSLLWTPADIDAWSLWAPALPYIISGLIVIPLAVSERSAFEQNEKLLLYFGCGLLLALAFIPKWGARSIQIEGIRDEIRLPLALGELAGYVFIVSCAHLKRNFASILIFILVLVGSIAVTIKSGSRGPLLFSAVASLVVIYNVMRVGFIAKYGITAAIGVVFVIVAVEFFNSTGAYTERWSADSMADDFGSRINSSEILLQSSFDRLGSLFFGLGNSASFSSNFLGIYPHMVPLEILAEEGLLGICLWLILTIRVVSFYQKSKHTGIVSEQRSVSILFGFWLFSTLLSFKQGSLITHSMPFFFAVLMERFISMPQHQYQKNYSLNRDGNKKRELFLFT